MQASIQSLNPILHTSISEFAYSDCTDGETKQLNLYFIYSSEGCSISSVSVQGSCIDRVIIKGINLEDTTASSIAFQNLIFENTLSLSFSNV